jgi:hypothetical protein
VPHSPELLKPAMAAGEVDLALGYFPDLHPQGKIPSADRCPHRGARLSLAACARGGWSARAMAGASRPRDAASRSLHCRAWRRRLGPDPNATVATPSGLTLKAGDPVVTYVVRNLEPYRGFHIFIPRFDKAYKVSDRDGLYAYVGPSGTFSLRYDHRIGRRRETLTLGRYDATAPARVPRPLDVLENGMGLSLAEA